ncbi:MAG: PAS domain-containing protein [Methanomicrobiales archaeon]|nr:PAS domain-containing protein [Methanomicrobiales archaeon]
MELRKKTLLYLNATFIIIIILTLVFSSNLLLSSYSELEEREVRGDLVRVTNLLRIQVDGISRTAGDYAAWDDTYEFVERGKEDSIEEDYIEANFIEETFQNLNINLVIITDADAGVLYAVVYDPVQEALIPLPASWSAYFDRNSALYGNALPESPVAGIIRFPEGPMIIASRAVQKSDHSGPPNGFLVMGAYLDNERIDALGEAIGLPVEIRENNPNLASAEVVPVSDAIIDGFVPVRDILGNEPYLIHISESRDIYQQGKATLLAFTAVLLVIGLTFGLLSIMLIDRALLSRLSLLAVNVAAIGGEGDVSRRVGTAGDDEISHLGDAINRMLAKIQQIQTNLQESETRYRGIVNDQTDFICRFRSDGVVTFANEIFCDYIGRPAEDIFGAVFSQDILPEDLPLVKKAMQTVTADLPAETTEFRVVRPDGSIRWQHWTIRGIFDETGKVTEYLMVGQDITDLKVTQEALLESQRMQAALMGNLPGMVFRGANDANWTMEFVSDGSHSLTGYTPDELVGGEGTGYEDLVAKEDVPLVWNTIREALSENKPYRVRYRIHTRSGDEKWVWELGNGVYRDGTCIGLEGFIMDITAVKRSQDAIAEANRKLNLLNSITRHDILNQLTALIGYIELAGEDTADAHQKRYLQKMDGITETIRGQIEFTRDYQQLGVTGAQWYEVDATIRQGIAPLDLGKVQLSVGVGRMEIYADPLLGRVFYNLVDNSLNHGGPALSRIDISGRKTAEGCLLIYEDDGEGISTEDKKRIFSAGFGKINGYGLFLIREVLQITGISITETGEPGKGARFEMFIPRSRFRNDG